MRYLIAICFLGLSYYAGAQATAGNTDPIAIYNKGVELFEKEKYGAAMHEFDQYVKQGQDAQTIINSKYYSAVCGIRLEHRDGEKRLIAFTKDYPENSRINDANWELAKFYFGNEKWRKSVKYLEKVEPFNLLSEDLNEYYFKLGYSHFMKEEYEEAKKGFEKIIYSKNKYYTKANYYYGYINYKEGNYDKALTAFEKIKDGGPKTMDLYIVQIYYAKGNYKKAIAHGDTLTFKDIKNEVNFIIGKSYYQLADYSKAVEYFNQYNHKISDLLDEENYQIGYSYYALDKYDKAYVYFMRIANNNDSLGQVAGYNLAHCFLKLDKKENARNAFYEASRVDYNKAVKETAEFNYAKLSFELSFQNVAIDAFQSFINTYPKSEYIDEARGLLAELFLQTQNYKDAVIVMEGITNLNDRTKKAYQKISYFWAEDRYANKQFDVAEEYFKKALKYKEDRVLEAQTYFWLGELSYASRDYNGAISNFNKAIDNSQAKESKYYNICFYNLGYTYFDQKNYGKALNYFKKYTDLENYYNDRPNRYLDASIRLADCYFMTKNYDGAIDKYNYIVTKKGPGSDYSLYQIATIYGLQSKDIQKLNTLSKLLSNYPSSIYLDDAEYESGMLNMNNREYSKALTNFNNLVNSYPSSNYVSKAQLNIGNIYVKQSNNAKAITQLEYVAKSYKGSDESKSALRILEEVMVSQGDAEEYIAFVKSIGETIEVTRADSLLYVSIYQKYRNGSCNQSVINFDNYLKNSPDGNYRTEANYYKAECEYELGNLDKAIVNYEAVVASGNNNFIPRSSSRAAYIHFRNKEYEKALYYYKELEKSTNTKDYLTTALIGQMRCNYLLEEYAFAKKDAERVIANETSTKDALIEANLVLGRVNFMDDDLSTAKANFTEVVKGTKSVMAAESKYYLCQIQFKEEDYKGTKKGVFELMDNHASYDYWVAKGFILLADVYLAEGDTFQAKATLKTVVDSYKGKELGNIAEEKLRDLESKEAIKPEDDE